MGQVLKLQPFATPEDETISLTVRALISGRGHAPEFVAYELGLTKTTLYNKLRGTSPWKASEVARLARFFRVRIGDLYSGLEGQFGPQDPTPTTGVAGSRLGESNPGPSHYKSHDRLATVHPLVPRRNRSAGATGSADADATRRAS